MTQPLLIPEPEVMIEHVRCIECGAIRPLSDGEVLFTLEDDWDYEDEKEMFDSEELGDMYWQCVDCFHSVPSRTSLTVFALPEETRRERTT